MTNIIRLSILLFTIHLIGSCGDSVKMNDEEYEVITEALMEKIEDYQKEQYFTMLQQQMAGNISYNDAINQMSSQTYIDSISVAGLKKYIVEILSQHEFTLDDYKTKTQELINRNYEFKIKPKYIESL